MSPKLELRSFADFSADELGETLSQIVGHRPNAKLLKRDFLNLSVYYGSRRRAIRSVRARMQHLRQTPGYAVQAILADGKVIGVTTMLQMAIPPAFTTNGPSLAMWLDPSRPDNLRRIGREVMELRLELLLKRHDFKGQIWTVIRPDNTPSLRIWRHSYDRVHFLASGQPRNYSTVDSIKEPRQLLVSNLTLEELRR